MGLLEKYEFIDGFLNQVSALLQSGHQILSQPIKVEVYAPPRILPQDIFLVPGASHVVCYHQFFRYFT